MAGSIRWIRTGENEARFDIVTYWTRSFSVFNNPNKGQQLKITAQSTVQFDPGDGATQYLVANVTKVSIEEDWFEAVTVVHHTYSQVNQAGPFLELLQTISRR
jgi:predicted transcriptional regulator YdeE